MPRRILIWGSLLNCCALIASLSAGEELLPPETSISAAIDHYVDTQLHAVNVEAAASIDDAAFLRRLSLDLNGRIPTRQELNDFLAMDGATRRQDAIEVFLSQVDFVFHQANEIDLLLLARIREDREWREFLLQAVKDRTSWSNLFTQIMLPEVTHPGETAPGAYLRERVRELDDLTNDTAVLFFGVNISCAKCHDHPLVPDWEQDHYFGMASFFKRTYQTKSKLLAEHFTGDVKFTNIVGEEKQAAFMFLNGQAAEEPEIELSDEKRKSLDEAIQKAKKEDDAKAPEVEFSPREELVRLALEGDSHDFFARNIVNRIWARLIGRGLVTPLDQMHSDNPPSHPALLDWLTRDLKQHDYDLKRLIAGIVGSEVYARSCRWESESAVPEPSLFAVGVVRPLNPRQLALSLQIASTSGDRLPGLDKGEDWEKQRADLENRAARFANQFPIPEDGFQVGTDEALFFSNSQQFEGEFLRSSDDRLVGELKKIENSDELIQTLVSTVYSRSAQEEEQQAMRAYLESATDDASREDKIQQLVWALLASPEFRFNH